MKAVYKILELRRNKSVIVQIMLPSIIIHFEDYTKYNITMTYAGRMLCFNALNFKVISLVLYQIFKYIKSSFASLFRYPTNFLYVLKGTF